MAKGARYNIYGIINLYSNAEDARRQANAQAKLSDNGEGAGVQTGIGTPYLDVFSGSTSYKPAIPIWWVPKGGSGGYSIGWINETENGFPLYIGDSAGKVRRAKAVWVGGADSKPKRAKGVWVGGVGGQVHKGK